MKKKILAVLSMAALCCVTVASASFAGDNGNGTVTVNGKIWLKDAGCLGPVPWDSAKGLAAQLAAGQCGLKDNSTAGQWHLPTKAELINLYSSQSMFSNVTGRSYWTTTVSEINANGVYIVKIGSGDFSSKAVSTLRPFYVWPVKN